MLYITTGTIRDIKALEAEGWFVIDITIKSASEPYKTLFAPTWDMVMGHKKGKINDAQYTELYHEMMCKSFMTYYTEWYKVVAEHDKVALVCYCRKGSFCHRHLLKEYLARVAEYYNIQVEIIPE